MNKIRHHPILILMILWFLWVAITMVLGGVVNKWFFLLFLPGLALYLFGFWWNDKELLICPGCGFEPWSKSSYYCSGCGVLLVFRREVKVRKNSAVPKERVPVHICSKGHTVNTFDKFCPKCGEPLYV